MTSNGSSPTFGVIRTVWTDIAEEEEEERFGRGAGVVDMLAASGAAVRRSRLGPSAFTYST